MSDTVIRNVTVGAGPEGPLHPVPPVPPSQSFAGEKPSIGIVLSLDRKLSGLVTIERISALELPF